MWNGISYWLRSPSIKDWMDGVIQTIEMYVRYSSVGNANSGSCTYLSILVPNMGVNRSICRSPGFRIKPRRMSVWDKALGTRGEKEVYSRSQPLYIHTLLWMLPTFAGRMQW